MTTRIVHNLAKKAREYPDATVAIKKFSYVMGEIVDSFYMKCYTVPEYLNRTKDYVDTLGGVVDIWEVGNEINGIGPLGVPGSASRGPVSPSADVAFVVL